MQKQNQPHPIDINLEEIKKNLFNNFTKKWSAHKCSFGCSFTSKEYGTIPIGCPQTPKLLNYYCENISNKI